MVTKYTCGKKKYKNTNQKLKQHSAVADPLFCSQTQFVDTDFADELHCCSLEAVAEKRSESLEKSVTSLQTTGPPVIKKTWCLTSTETTRHIRDWEKGGRGYRGGGKGRLYTYHYTVTAGMTPAFRWAAMRPIFKFH